MAVPFPETPPFRAPRERGLVTSEPAPGGDRWVPEHNDREWIGSRNQGGGMVPEEHTWTSNPKQHQDDLGNK